MGLPKPLRRKAIINYKIITEVGIFLNNDFAVNGFETLRKLFFTTFNFRSYKTFYERVVSRELNL